MLLRLENVAKLYGNRLIFKGVSFEIASGGITLLAGANGAGKSTLLKIMAGLVRPDTGTVHTELASSEIGYLGHQTFIYPHLSARENLAFWHALYPAPSHKKMSGAERKTACNTAIDAVLARVGLHAFAEERAGTFSRGMAQRLNLARVLMQRPKLLLLDEPTTGLDARSRAVLDGELLKATQNGVGIVWISHSIKEDLAKADFLLMLEERTLGFSGRAKDYEASHASTADTALKNQEPVRASAQQGTDKTEALAAQKRPSELSSANNSADKSADKKTSTGKSKAEADV